MGGIVQSHLCHEYPTPRPPALSQIPSEESFGLTQDELAYLFLGAKYGSKVSQYERRVRLPVLRNALAYEIVLGVPVGALFRGIAEEVRLSIAKRAVTFRTSWGSKVHPKDRAELLDKVGRGEETSVDG